MHTHQCATRTQKPLQRAEIAADMDIDVNQHNRRNISNGSILHWRNHTFRANIRPRTAPHFQGIRTKGHPHTNINTSRNSRPSFLIDDVRFWMRFSNMEHAPFTTPQTWHNRVGNNALQMKIRCQQKLCYSVAFPQLFSSSLTIQDLHSHTFEKQSPQESGDSEANHESMLNIVLGPFIQQKQERRKRKEKGERKKEKGKKEKKNTYIYIYVYICMYIYIHTKKERKKKDKRRKKNKERTKKRRKKKREKNEKKRKEKKRKEKTRQDKKRQEKRKKKKKG